MFQTNDEVTKKIILSKIHCAAENKEKILTSIITTGKAYIWQGRATFWKDNEHQAAVT